jgi:hypothetical protein
LLGSNLDSGGPTLADYAKTWIRERNVKPRTRIWYESLWENHISSTLGKVPLVHLTPESVRTWYSGLGSEHVRRNSHAYGLLRQDRADLTVVRSARVPLPCAGRANQSTSPESAADHVIALAYHR